MEEKATTTSQVCCDVLVKEVPREELQKLYRSLDISPEPRQFCFDGCCYNDQQLQQLKKRATLHSIGPRYAECCTLQAKLNSFKDKWPEGKLPIPEALSTAGFFYDGEFPSNFD
jgi:hypothetical protein